MGDVVEALPVAFCSGHARVLGGEPEDEHVGVFGKTEPVLTGTVFVETLVESGVFGEIDFPLIEDGAADAINGLVAKMLDQL